MWQAGELAHKLLPTAAIVLLATACSETSEPQFSGPWATEIQSAYDNAASDFQREVLRDGEVTADEYVEAQQRLVECGADKGLEITLLDTGYSTSHPNLSEGEAIFDECSRSTIDGVEPVYDALTKNPQRIPREELYFQCFQELGIVTEEMSPETFRTRLPNPELPEERACLEDPLNPTVSSSS